MDLPGHLRHALTCLGDDPTITIVSWEMIHELIARGLIERQAGNICFTEAGLKLFQEIRGSKPKRNI